MIVKSFMKPLLLNLLLACSTTVIAQDKIEAERPGETQSARLVQTGKFQTEIGFARKKTGPDITWQEPQALFRYGLFSKLELRLDVTVEKEDLISKNESRRGLLPPAVGLKFAAYQSRNKSFTSAITAMAGIGPLASNDHNPGKFIHRVRLLFDNKFSEKFHLEYNFGTEWNSEEQEQVWVYTVSPKLELTDHLSLFAERFGYLKQGSHPQHHYDGGIAWLLKKNIQVDVYGGIGVGPTAPDYFINAGLSFSLP